MNPRVSRKSPAPSTLSTLQVDRVARLLKPFLDKNEDARLRGRLRYGYRSDGPAVVFFESSPSLDDRSLWIDHDIAKFRFTKRTGLWSLYCQFRDLKWRAYEPLPYAEDVAELVQEMERDPTAIFFG